MSNTDCLFCQIVAGKIPSHKIYEDANSLAFLDIYPAVEGFTLVIPKKHSPYVWDMAEDDYQYLMKTVKKVGSHLRDVLKPDRVGVHVEGIHVEHTHVKVIPFSTAEEFHRAPDMSREPDHAALAAMAKKLYINNADT